MAEGIAEMTKFFARHGHWNRRLKALGADDEMPLVQKWQYMMEIFMSTQVHVIAGMGYSADEEGLQAFAEALQACLDGVDEDMKELLAELRRDTWHEVVAATFDLNLDDVKPLTIVDARNIMHKVSTRMIEPSVLLDIQTKVSKIAPIENAGVTAQEQQEAEALQLVQKHHVLQDIIVNTVYLAPDKKTGVSLIQECGYPGGPKGYAMLQCAMTEFEADPLIAQYVSAAMMRIYEAANIDVSSLTAAARELAEEDEASRAASAAAAEALAAPQQKK